MGVGDPVFGAIRKRAGPFSPYKVDPTPARPNEERASRILSGIQKSAARLSGLIDDLLDFARGRFGSGLILNLDTDEPLEPVLNQVVAELRAS